MAIVLTDDKHYKAIADVIRDKLDSGDTFLPEFLADNVENVYEAGVVDGKQAGDDRFWDAFQKNGERVDYAYAFSYGWTDDVYNPKYPIEANSAGYMYALTGITDTKIPLVIKAETHIIGFMRHSSITTVNSLDISNVTDATNAFQGMDKLANITFTGTIPVSLNFQWSPLSVDSMKNIISCLKEGAGATLTFKDDCWAALEADSSAPNGGTWANYVSNLGWTV